MRSADKAFWASQEDIMNKLMPTGLAMLAGFALGATAVSNLRAQSKLPGAYAILDISEITDAEIFRQLLPKAIASVTSAGGQYIVRTDKITPLSGAPPVRAVVIAFDNVDKAKAWYASPAQKEVNALADRSQKGRSFIAEGMSN
jgi:uncharacterized protein (DUF1330 family)